ncbi:MAG: class I SAM-dependent methyltransferase [Pseudomonadota bacterium]
MTSLGRLFDWAAQDYDRERRALVPCFDAFYGAALDALASLPSEARILDLGAGTGLFSGLLAAARPGVSFTLVDLAPAMLEQAVGRFAALGASEPALVVADYAQEMPEGPFDAVISALSIHHVADKAGVLSRARRVLRPGAPFVNAEQIAGATAEEEASLDAAWEAAALQLGASTEVIAAARARMAHDRCVSLENNLALLAAAGFRDIHCPFRDGRFAVLAARAPEGRAERPERSQKAP